MTEPIRGQTRLIVLWSYCPECEVGHSVLYVPAAEAAPPEMGQLPTLRQATAEVDAWDAKHPKECKGPAWLREAATEQPSPVPA